ncbi:MAG: 2-C-methyl-D-erythritol 2,4-cyclodiphosphate synthase [Halieaceae bacterium]
MRIGQGYDVHAFGEGDQVTLGGVSIPHDRGLLAHSDGDVLLHALCDALLGAVAAGDIGVHFSDRDPANAGIDSRELLRRSYAIVWAAGYQLGNADLTVVAQAPRIGPHVDAMRGHIATDLGVQSAQISVKATTTEGLGFTGREEGIAAYAVVLLEGR